MSTKANVLYSSLAKVAVGLKKIPKAALMETSALQYLNKENYLLKFG
jgi:hypothetical protein